MFLFRFSHSCLLIQKLLYTWEYHEKREIGDGNETRRFNFFLLYVVVCVLLSWISTNSPTLHSNVNFHILSSTFTERKEKRDSYGISKLVLYAIHEISISQYHQIMIKGQLIIHWIERLLREKLNERKSKLTLWVCLANFLWDEWRTLNHDVWTESSRLTHYKTINNKREFVTSQKIDIAHWRELSLPSTANVQRFSNQ